MESHHLTWHDSASCMSCELKRADLVVCMGGYNTLCEVMSMAKPALVWPRVFPRREQLMRTRLWESIGLVQAVDASLVTAESFASRVIKALLNPQQPDTSILDMQAIDRIQSRFDEYWDTKGSSTDAAPLHML